MEFKISKELIQQLEQLIQSKNDPQLEVLLNDMHHADIAEILDELDFDEAYKGILMLPKDARLGVLIAYAYYRRLFTKIRSIPSHRIMEERIRIPNSSKYALLMTCYIKNNLNLI